MKRVTWYSTTVELEGPTRLGIETVSTVRVDTCDKELHDKIVVLLESLKEEKR